MSKSSLVRSVVSLALAALAPACTTQGMATMKPMDMAGVAQGPGPSGPLVASTMADQLQAAGLDIKNLPPLDEVDDDHMFDVMKIISTSLGAKCTDCHVMDKEAETPQKRVARKMWDEFVVKLSLKDGSPLFCDSCHQGKLEFLDRTDDKALSGWMKTYFVDGLVRKDGAKHSCATCHGMPFKGEFLDDWENGGEVEDGGTGPTDGGTTPSDGSVVVADMGATPDMAQPPADMAQPGTCKPVINEVQVAGSAGASDEFIELFNPCPQAVSVDSYTLVYRSAAGTSDSTLLKLSGQSIPAGGYLVAGGSAFSGTATVRYTAGLAGTGGGVALREGTTLVDSVGYGTATNAFVQGSAAAAPASGKSIARTPNGSRAHGDNSLDFTVVTPSPGASN